MSLNDQWQKFLLSEELSEKTIFTYIQGLKEIIANVKPRTMTEKRRLALAEGHLREVKRYARKMQNNIDLLQERIGILEESQGDQ
tara:strand:- start:3990 stop:4244 length:255 start_codon:yes stop_codon:yes gene_type:complete